MSKNTLVVSATKKGNKITSRYDFIDAKMFEYAYYFLKNQIFIVGLTKNSASMYVHKSAITINLTERDWKTLQKRKEEIFKKEQKANLKMGAVITLI